MRLPFKGYKSNRIPEQKLGEVNKKGRIFSTFERRCTAQKPFIAAEAKYVQSTTSVILQVLRRCDLFQTISHFSWSFSFYQGKATTDPRPKMVLHTSGYGPTHLNLNHTCGSESGLNIFSPQMYPMVIAPPPTNAEEITHQNVVDRMPWCIIDGRPIINLKSCTLTPPAPDSVQFEKRERPKGCKTVFIGRTPENFTGKFNKKQVI